MRARTLDVVVINMGQPSTISIASRIYEHMVADGEKDSVLNLLASECGNSVHIDPFTSDSITRACCRIAAGSIGVPYLCVVRQPLISLANIGPRNFCSGHENIGYIYGTAYVLQYRDASCSRFTSIANSQVERLIHEAILERSGRY